MHSLSSDVQFMLAQLDQCIEELGSHKHLHSSVEHCEIKTTATLSVAVKK
jgi:hypothetical protein